MSRILLLHNSPKYRAVKNPKFNNGTDWKKFYGSMVWRNMRQQKLEEQPLCEECLKNGKVTPAQHVHHIIKFSIGYDEQQKWDLFLDWNNLESICVECHRKIHTHDK